MEFSASSTPTSYLLALPRPSSLAPWSYYCIKGGILVLSCEVNELKVLLAMLWLCIEVDDWDRLKLDLVFARFFVSFLQSDAALTEAATSQLPPSCPLLAVPLLVLTEEPPLNDPILILTELYCEETLFLFEKMLNDSGSASIEFNIYLSVYWWIMRVFGVFPNSSSAYCFLNISLPFLILR